jgi:pimeloyl-ACP methyl ester carboxylesterase
MNPSPASRADLLFYQEERERRTPGVRSSLRQLAVGILYKQGDLQAEVEYYRIHFGPTLRDTRLLEELISRLRRNFSREGLLKARQIETRLYEQTWDQEKFDLLPGLKELKTPTLVIHGEYDLVPVECAIHIADAIPRARLEVLQDYGHFAYMENIEVVMRVVEEWMKVVRSDE